MLQLNCSQGQAWGLLNAYGVPQDAVSQMRTMGAPNRGNYRARSMISSRGNLFAEETLPTNASTMQPLNDEPKPVGPARELKYTPRPRSTNAAAASIDAREKRSRKYCLS